ncbi:MAG: type II toxin-antitoxin system RelE/ParE family toxin [Firmicutes bacterium]|nr:type II toxin-antitoxin system RelE/ParE family toxin [Bacillota bacterium]
MSDAYKLIILPEAQQDIRNIVLYIANELVSPQAALNLQQNFIDEINKLSFMPKSIKPIDEQPWGALGVRKILVKNYYIYFIVDETAMEFKVIAAIYTKMDQTTQLAKRNADTQ